MARLTDTGRATVAQIARQHGLSEDAVASMAYAISRGGGTMAQFNHPEFGGSGQWMRGGMTMVSDLFNTALKMRVEQVCEALSSAMSSGALIALERGDPGHAWWPDSLGAPSATGGQNEMRFAVFPNARRLLVQRGEHIETYDIGDHTISGVSQQQSGGGATLSFCSQHGQFGLDALTRIDSEAAPRQDQGQRHGFQSQGSQSQFQTGGASPAPGMGSGQSQSQTNAPAPAPAAPAKPTPEAPPETAREPEPAPSPIPIANAPAASPHGSADPLDALERLATLVEKGLISREEFDAKKADLLSRI